MPGYDFVGDIHGCALSLQSLLERMGYRQVDGVYRHELRKVVFLGDFVDRGPLQRETIALVRPMVEQGYAMSVMGNHEFNAIAYHTYDSDLDDYLRRHSAENRHQHAAFLDAYAGHASDYRDVIAWFKTLPLWLDLGGVRVVHACWDEGAMARLQPAVGEGNRLSASLLKNASIKGRQEFRDVEVLLKGKEVPLAEGFTITDKDGHERKNIRIRWWDREAKTFQSAFMGDPAAIAHIPDEPIGLDHLIDYSHAMPPVILGHYWMQGIPAPLAANIACIDYSVGKPGGKLVAYRWDGEGVLQRERFVAVNRVEDG